MPDVDILITPLSSTTSAKGLLPSSTTCNVPPLIPTFHSETLVLVVSACTSTTLGE